MKKFLLFILCILTIFSLCSCQSDIKKADETAKGFVSALLIRDEEAMKQYIHPDCINQAMPDDEFYKNITENQFFTLGNSLDEIYAMGKSEFAQGVNEAEGEHIVYKYTILTNELFYDIDIRILENKNGYGISGFTFALNLDPQLYSGGETS